VPIEGTESPIQAGDIQRYTESRADGVPCHSAAEVRGRIPAESVSQENGLNLSSTKKASKPPEAGSRSVNGWLLPSLKIAAKS
jgi:hypothetical protein